MKIYILQMIAFQLVFLALYGWLLKKETFFQWNRMYLLVTPVIALFLPLIKVPTLQTLMPQNLMVSLPEITFGTATLETQNNLTVASPGFSIFEIILYSGMAISTLIFLKKLYKINQLKGSGKADVRDNISVVYMLNSTDAFSFAGTIFLGENLNPQSKKYIFAHEQVHIEQKHYLDLLYFEVLRIIFWFNPMVYFYQKRIAALHEYIADAKVVSQCGKTSYYQNLLSQVFQTQTVSFINSFFNHSLIKKRIVMLHKSKSKNVHLVKFALLLPVVALMLTFSSYSQEKKPSATSVESIPTPPKPPMPPAPAASVTQSIDIQEDMSVPFAVIDQVPIYPGCENLVDNAARKNCFSEKISLLVSENFNTKVVNNEMNLEAKQRITIQFKIDEKGNVVDVMARAAHPLLIEEAKRVIYLAPKMKPGRQKDKEVSVIYSLPIAFEISKEK